MRILWLGHFVPWPLRGGNLIRSYHLIREAAIGNEVSFLGFKQRELLDSEDLHREAHTELRMICSGVQTLPIPREFGPLPKHRIMARSLLSRSYDEVWLDSRAMRKTIGEEIARFSPDVVHFDTLGLAQYATLFNGQSLILNHHNIESHMMRRRAELKSGSLLACILRLQADRLQQAERRSARYFCAHLVVSELDKQRLQEVIPGSRMAVISNGVDLQYFRPRDATASFEPASTIFVGGLNWYPNRRGVKWFLSEVYPRIVKEFPEARFTMVGRCDDRFRADLLRHGSGVEMTGEVEDIRPFVAKSAVYVCPIHEGGGTRLKILDAMAQGIPLVATTMAVEGIGIKADEHALLADDAIGFARLVIEVIRRPELGRKLAAAAYDLVAASYSWESIGIRLRSVYESTRKAR